jgi:hypothetical protein
MFEDLGVLAEGLMNNFPPRSGGAVMPQARKTTVGVSVVAMLTPHFNLQPSKKQHNICDISSFLCNLQFFELEAGKGEPAQRPKCSSPAKHLRKTTLAHEVAQISNK